MKILVALIAIVSSIALFGGFYYLFLIAPAMKERFISEGLELPGIIVLLFTIGDIAISYPYIAYPLAMLPAVYGFMILLKEKPKT